MSEEQTKLTTVIINKNQILITSDPDHITRRINRVSRYEAFIMHLKHFYIVQAFKTLFR